MLDVALPLAFGFLLVLLRTAGLCVTAPVLSASSVPMRVRLAVSAALAFAVFTGAGLPVVDAPPNLFSFAYAGLVETAIGLGGGLCARMLLEAAQAAGSVAGLSSGLGYGALVDPLNGAASTVAGQLFSMLALGITVSLGLPGEAVAWLARSVVQIPPGHAVDLPALVQALITTAATASALSMRLCFPFMAAGLIAHASLGVLGRAAPQLNLQSVGFSISLAAGGFALYLVAPVVAEAAARSAAGFFAGGP
ncbi:MAG: flagellar biosynthetic protein FliR [Myxococcales bacterium]